MIESADFSAIACVTADHGRQFDRPLGLWLCGEDTLYNGYNGTALSMPRLKSVQSRWNGQQALVKAVVHVQPDLHLEVSAAPDLDRLEVGLIGKRWSARVEHPSQDALFRLKRQVKGATLTLEQAVPGGKTFLIPCPAVKVDRRYTLRSSEGGSTAVSSRTQVEHSFLTRRSIATQTLYSGLDRQHKLKLGFDNRMGPLLMARTKLRRGWVHSAAVAAAPATGPELQLKSRPAAGQKYSLTLQPQRQAAVGSVQLRPDGGHTKLTATAACSLADGRPKPRLALDLTWSV